jgi:hypothetical protein
MIEEMKKQKKKSDNGEYDGLFGVMIRRQKKKMVLMASPDSGDVPE